MNNGINLSLATPLLRSVPRRQTRARIHLRLSAAERSELESAARAAEYKRITPYILALARGEMVARRQADAVLAQARATIEVAVQSAVEAALASQAEKTTADLSVLAEQVTTLRECVIKNFGSLTTAVKALAARGVASTR